MKLIQHEAARLNSPNWRLPKPHMPAKQQQFETAILSAPSGPHLVECAVTTCNMEGKESGPAGVCRKVWAAHCGLDRRQCTFRQAPCARKTTTAILFLLGCLDLIWSSAPSLLATSCNMMQHESQGIRTLPAGICQKMRNSTRSMGSGFRQLDPKP